MDHNILKARMGELIEEYSELRGSLKSSIANGTNHHDVPLMRWYNWAQRIRKTRSTEFSF